MTCKSKVVFPIAVDAGSIKSAADWFVFSVSCVVLIVISVWKPDISVDEDEVDVSPLLFVVVSVAVGWMFTTVVSAGTGSVVGTIVGTIVVVSVPEGGVSVGVTTGVISVPGFVDSSVTVPSAGEASVGPGSLVAC